MIQWKPAKVSTKSRVCRTHFHACFPFDPDIKIMFLGKCLLGSVHYVKPNTWANAKQQKI